MTRDEILRMAREAGLCIDGEVAFSPNHDGADVDLVDLQTFAELVAAAEREACAKECEAGGGFQDGYSCAAAIRARRDQ